MFSYHNLPHRGRRECTREPLPLEGAVERSEAGLASFFAAKPPPFCLPHAGKALFRGSQYSRIAAFPIGEGGPRQRWIGCSRKRRT